MTGVFINNWGTWHKIQSPRVNVEAVWLPCKVYAKADDQWHLIYGRVAEIIPFPTRHYWVEGVQDVCISAA